jgi:hypothetical protein
MKLFALLIASLLAPLANAGPLQVLTCSSPSVCADASAWVWVVPTSATVALVGNATSPNTCAALSSVPAATSWVWVSTDGGATLTPQFISAVAVAP